jgi:hypothetical protein
MPAAIAVNSFVLDAMGLMVPGTYRMPERPAHLAI